MAQNCTENETKKRVLIARLTEFFIFYKAYSLALLSLENSWFN